MGHDIYHNPHFLIIQVVSSLANKETTASQISETEQLIDTFEQATSRLSEPNPPLVPVIGEAAKLGAKRLILQRFPFSIVAIAKSQAITVVALAHHSRKPGYWFGRITP